MVSLVIFLWYVIWVSLQTIVSCACNLDVKTKGYLSSTHSPCRYRREGSHWVLSNLRSLGTMASPNYMGLGKCRGHLQAPWGFGVFPFIPPSLRSVQSPFYLHYPDDFTKHSSQQGMTFDPLGMLFTTWCDELDA